MQSSKKRFMIRKKLIAAVLICLCSQWVLYGCTKKEELILLNEGQQVQADAQDIFADTEASGSDGQSTLGETVEAEQNAGNDIAAADSQNVQKNGQAAADADRTAFIEKETGRIYIHICGAVMSPGVYELEAGSRVYEAVQAAGGFAEYADDSYVNQAQELPDGVKLVIPTKEEVESVRQAAKEGKSEGQVSPAGEGQAATDSGIQIGITAQGSAGTIEGAAGTETESALADDGKVNINTASAEELCKIPGIGATRAAAVISYREKHGSFESPEDIMKVSGIKEGTYEKIKDSISVK